MTSRLSQTEWMLQPEPQRKRAGKGVRLRSLLSVAAAVRVISGLGLAQEAAPVIIQTSMTASPGDVIGVYGANFGTNATVGLLRLSGFSGTLSPAAADVSVPVLHVQDMMLHGLIPPGTNDLYALWVNTVSGGWSRVAFINRAEAFWSSESQVYPGQEVRIFGRNFLNPTTGTASGTAVQLVRTDDGQTVDAAVTRVTENAVDFVIPSSVSTNGSTYTVKVSNGAGGTNGWSQMSNSEGFKVVGHNANIRAVQELCGIAEAWTASIPTGKLYNAKVDFGAVGDGTADDTAAAQNALNAAAATGGIAYFPAGTYSVGKLTLGDKTLITGDGSGASILRLNAGTRLIDTSTSAGGIFNVGLDSPLIRTNLTRMIFGYTGVVRLWGNKTGGFFLKDVTVTASDGSGFYSDSQDDVIIENCSFTVTHCNVVGYNGRNRIRNSTFYNTQRPVFFLPGRNGYAWIENNVIGAQNAGNGCEPAGDASEHRIMDLGCVNNFICSNTVTGQFGRVVPRDDNSGEGILFQAASRKVYSRVSAGTINSLTDNAASFTNNALTNLLVAIVDGRGIGQLRRITANTATVLTVDTDWTAVPDSSSVYTVDTSVNYHNIIANNNISASLLKGGVVLYTKNFDNIIRDNVLENTGGIWLGQVQVCSQQRADFSFFPYVKGNILRGVSDARGGKGNCCVIGPCVDGGPGTSCDTNLVSVGLYGCELRDNSLTGAGTNIPPASTYNGYFVNGSGIMVSTVSATNRPVALGGIVQGNTVNNTKAGIHLSNAAYDTAVVGNIFTGNGSEIHDLGSVRTVGTDDLSLTGSLTLNECDVGPNGFTFTVGGNVNMAFLVQACSNLADPVWVPLATNRLWSGRFPFCDPAANNHTSRFYRVLLP